MVARSRGGSWWPPDCGWRGPPSPTGPRGCPGSASPTTTSSSRTPCGGRTSSTAPPHRGPQSSSSADWPWHGAGGRVEAPAGRRGHAGGGVSTWPSGCPGSSVRCSPSSFWRGRHCRCGVWQPDGPRTGWPTRGGCVPWWPRSPPWSPCCCCRVPVIPAVGRKPGTGGSAWALPHSSRWPRSHSHSCPRCWRTPPRRPPAPRPRGMQARRAPVRGGRRMPRHR